MMDEIFLVQFRSVEAVKKLEFIKKSASISLQISLENIITNRDQTAFFQMKSQHHFDVTVRLL